MVEEEEEEKKGSGVVAVADGSDVLSGRNTRIPSMRAFTFLHVCSESGDLDSSHSRGDEKITEPKHPVCREKKINISLDPCFAARLLQGVMM